MAVGWVLYFWRQDDPSTGQYNPAAGVADGKLHLDID